MDSKGLLNGFELIEQIGQGGIGAVWKARQLSLDRIVAIKLLLPEYSRDKDENRRLVSEARTAAKLKHSGIVQVYDAIEENGTFFFVMEYVAGYNVGKWLHRKHQLSEADTITVGLAVAEALDYAWRAAKLIHCDIKPDNIMVDTDGAIKVADLGLSRTLDNRSDAQDDYVLGTPSYMSPEQVEGQSELDCRTDIYALGATMYHMATGHRPFQEVPDRKAADLQISGHLSDAMELNPALSPAFCAVLEKMLAKNRDDRYAFWYEVAADMRLVLAHKALKTPLLPPGASTMHRSPKRALNSMRIAARAGKFALLGVLVVLALAAVMLLAKPFQELAARFSNPAPLAAAAAPAAPVDVHRTDEAAANKPAVSADLADYGAWQSWYQSNMSDFDGSIARLTEVIRRHPGSEGAAKAGRVLATLRKQRDEAVRLAWERLESEAGDLARKQQFAEAARLLDAYNGPCAAALQTNRAALAGTYRDSDAKRLDSQRTHFEQTLLSRLGALLSTGACAAAHAEIAARLADKPELSAALRDTLLRISTVISAATNFETRVLDTFAAQAGQSVTVEMGQGSQVLQIVAVEGGRVRARPAGVAAEIGFGVGELSAAERERRFGLLNDDAAWLRRGVAAAGENNLDAAREDFKKIGPPLGALLLAQFEEQRKVDVEAQAQAARNLILEGVGLNAEVIVDGVLKPEAVGGLLLSVGVADQTIKRLQAFRERFGSSLVAHRAAPVFNALERECERMIQDVGDRRRSSDDSPAVRGSELTDALVDANPGLKKHAVDFTERRGRVVTIRVRSDSLKDLSPLTQADSLREVTLEPVERETLTVDIRALTRLPELATLCLKRVSIHDPTVLAGLKLQDLTVERAGLQDLQWARNLALRRLDVSGNPLKDFSPLRNMEGLESLFLNDTGLADLERLPLRRLHELGISRTAVRDFGLLREAPLNRLDVVGVKIMDWTWLRGLALKHLDVSDSSFREPALLNRMPLLELIMRNTAAGDLSALKGLPLVQLDVSGTGLQELSQLRGLRLEDLSLARTRVNSSALAFLSGMPLHRLDLSETAVTDLRPLRGLPLDELNLSGVRVRDLTPLHDLPLTSLNIEDTGVKDLTPLKGMSIEFLRLTVGDKQNLLRDLRPILRGLPSLQEVNGKRVEAILRGQQD